MRPVLARLSLVAFGLAVLVVALVVVEVGLRALGVGEARTHDPFAGFSDRVPLFEPFVAEDARRLMRTAAARRTRSRAAFAAEKPEGALRIFVVGGSSAAGFPYGYDYAFSSFLEQRLAAELGAGRVEVVNAAVEGYASRRIAAIVEEIARYEPDLLIVYSGHNEMAERRFYAHLLDMPPALFRVLDALAATRLYALASGFATPLAPPPELRFENKRALAEMFAVGEARQGAERSEALDRELAYAELHYRFNLERMVDAMRAVGADVLLLGLTQNWADWAPGLSRHRDGLAGEGLAAWERAWAAGRALAGTDCAAALEAWRPAIDLDDGHAALRFGVAGCLRHLGHADAARVEFVAASDRDAIPHGAPSHYGRLLREVADEGGAMWLDVDALLAARRADGLVGDAEFLDMVHPRLDTHVVIAEAIADHLAERGWLPPDRRSDAWQRPTVDALVARDPKLWVRERLGRATACLLARRFACADEALDEVLARHPEDADALRVRGIAESLRARAGAS